MIITNANANLIRNKDVPNPLKLIERVGRICYKSEDKITDTSYQNFIKMLVGRKHLAMLEHGTVYLKLGDESTTESDINDILNAMQIVDNLMHIQKYIDITFPYISGSFRAFHDLFELWFSYFLKRNDDNMFVNQIFTTLKNTYPEAFVDLPDEWVDATTDYNYQVHELSVPAFKEDVRQTFCNWTKEKLNDTYRKHIRHTVVFTCDRGVSHELVRHRPASFGQESTRYCNYAKEKFGNEITVIKPCFWDEDTKAYKRWATACELAENAYFDLLINGAIPQEARSVLPNSLKTEIGVTATETEWQHILNLRLYGTTGAPHPQMVEVMKIAQPQLLIESNNRLH